MEINGLASFYRGRKVFVTGHTGFKGAWLCWWLHSLGAEVTGYALPPEEGRENLFLLTGLDKHITSVLGDVRSREQLAGAIENTAPEIIFHLAAQSLVRRSYHEPVATYEVNVMGTVNLLEAARNCASVKAILNITTDKCYENDESGKRYKESDPLGGYDPYSSSKAASELVTAAYRRSFLAQDNKLLASARAGNVIGGGDFSQDRIFPDCVEALQNNRKVMLRHPDATRPWQHVLDACYGYLLLAKELASGNSAVARAFNFSPDDKAVTVETLVKAFYETLGKGGYTLGEHNLAFHEAQQLQLDSTLAKQLLGWQAALGVENAVQWTAEWYAAFLSGKDAKEATLRQILAYQPSAS